MDDKDPIVFHTAVQALRSLKAVDAVFAVVDSRAASPQLRKGALQVLQSIHEPRVVAGLSAFLSSETDAARRLGLVGALSRLANREAAWNGTWWATRPQNVGPVLTRPRRGPKRPRSRPRSMPPSTRRMRQRLSPWDANSSAMARRPARPCPSSSRLRSTEPTLIPQITSYFADAETIPAEAIPVLQGAMTAAGTAPAVRVQAISALARTSNAASWAAIPAALQALQGAAGGGRGGGGGGGRGGGAAPVAAPGAALNAVQTSLVTRDGRGRRRATARGGRGADGGRRREPRAAQRNRAALDSEDRRARAGRGQPWPTARADYYARIQSSVARLSAPQAAALAAQQAVAVPAAGGGRRRWRRRPWRCRLRRAWPARPCSVRRGSTITTPCSSSRPNAWPARCRRRRMAILLNLAARKIGSDAARAGRRAVDRPGLDQSAAQNPDHQCRRRRARHVTRAADRRRGQRRRLRRRANRAQRRPDARHQCGSAPSRGQGAQAREHAGQRHPQRRGDGQGHGRPRSAAGQ